MPTTTPPDYYVRLDEETDTWVFFTHLESVDKTPNECVSKPYKTLEAATNAAWKHFNACLSGTITEDDLKPKESKK